MAVFDLDIRGKKKIHFTGIGGSGMRGLALYLKKIGKSVSGSDRLVDKKMEIEAFGVLRKAGVRIYPQDGSGIFKDTDYIIRSTAVEEDNPDILKGKKNSIKIIHRSDLLAGLFNDSFGIAVGGTNGKTTTSAMIVHVLREGGFNPSFCIGGEIINYKPYSSFGFGKSKYFCIEADESDGTIEKYSPEIGVITNISRDHLEIDELKSIFKKFGSSCRRKLIIGTDNHILRKMKFENIGVYSYGIKLKADTGVLRYQLKNLGSIFYLGGKKFKLNVPGIHNIYNALPAIIIGREMGLSDKAIACALETFPGVRRRFQRAGEFRGITVIDDFAHSPDKISATLALCRSLRKRIVAIYQPHGFMPTYKHRDGFLIAWKNYLTKSDLLLIPEIYYVGGTVPESARGISSHDLVKDARDCNLQAFYFKNRENILEFLTSHAESGDLIVVMGARDDSLSAFCREILENLRK